MIPFISCISSLTLGMRSGVHHALPSLQALAPTRPLPLPGPTTPVHMGYMASLHGLSKNSVGSQQHRPPGEMMLQVLHCRCKAHCHAAAYACTCQQRSPLQGADLHVQRACAWQPLGTAVRGCQTRGCPGPAEPAASGQGEIGFLYHIQFLETPFIMAAADQRCFITGAAAERDVLCTLTHLLNDRINSLVASGCDQHLQG